MQRVERQLTVEAKRARVKELLPDAEALALAHFSPCASGTPLEQAWLEIAQGVLVLQTIREALRRKI
jgi:DNA-directed RNA polymerase subunit K/omega